MAGKSAILTIKIISDATKAAQGFDQVEGRSSKMSTAVTKAAKITAVALVAIGTASYKQASALEQSAGAVESVFGKQAAAVDKAAKAAQNSLGLARSEYQQMAAVFGAQLQNMGVSSSELVPTTQRLIDLGGDLAATFGGTTADAVEALSSLMRGERDPIEKYGVSIKQADIAARLAAQGQAGLTGEAQRAAEAEATLAILYEQTAAAQGQRAREASSAEAAEQRLAASLKNTAATIGTLVLPVVADLASKTAAAVAFAGEHETATKIVLGVLATLAATVMTVNAAMKAYAATKAAIIAVTTAWKLMRTAVVTWTVAKRTALLVNLQWQSMLLRQAIAQRAAAASTIAMTAAQKTWQAATVAGTAIMGAFNAVMAMNPIILVVLAVAALTAALVLAYKKSETFRNIVQSAGRIAADAVGWIVDKVSSLVSWVRDTLPRAWNTTKDLVLGYINLWLSPIQWVIDKVSSLITWIGKIKWPSPPKWLSQVGSFLGLGGGPDLPVGPPPAAGGAGYAASSYGGRGGPGDDAFMLRTGGRGAVVAQVNITVNGAVDPVSTAQQISKLFRRANVIVGTA